MDRSSPRKERKLAADVQIRAEPSARHRGEGQVMAW